MERKKVYGPSFLLLSIIVILVYGNSLSCGWHFDDVFNIIKNENVTIGSLSPGALLQSMRGLEGYFFNRPLSYMSFALNWAVGGDNVVGYHLVNIAIHLGCAILLWWCVTELIALARPLVSASVRYQTALLVSVIWAIHPIQVQAVTYIVQRMASLAALFYLGALLAYLKMRRSHGAGSWRHWLFIGLLVLLSVASKQNGIMVLGAFVLVEFLFFRDGYDESHRIWGDRLFWGTCFFGCVGVAALFYSGSFSYEFRSYSLYERLLTQSRVIWFYLGLILFPVGARFSIVHDYILSTGLLTPLATIFSLAGIGGGIGGSLFFRRRFPLAAFSCLFFFLNHLVESSFIPLEMIFEHRNYLPLMFLFVAPALSFVLYLENSPPAKSYVYVSLGAAILIAVGMGTYGRNFDWRDDETLWQSALAHSPHSARTHQNLANVKLERGGMDIEAYYEVQMAAETLNDDTINRAAYVSMNNSVDALKRMGRYPEALGAAQRFLALHAENLESMDKVMATIAELKLRLHRYQELLDGGALFFERPFKGEALTGLDPIFLALVGTAAVKVGAFDEAFFVGIALLRHDGDDLRAYAILTMAALGQDRPSTAEHYLKKMKTASGSRVLQGILEMEVAKYVGDTPRAREAARALVRDVGLRPLVDAQESLSLWPVPDYPSLVKEVDAVLGEMSLDEIVHDTL